MRPKITVMVCVMALVLVQTTGCYSFRPLKDELPTTWTPGMKARFVRVDLKNGDGLELTRASRDSVEIRGEALHQPPGSHRQPVAIPLIAVAQVEERYFNWRKAAIATGSVVLVAGGAFLIALAQAVGGG